MFLEAFPSEEPAPHLRGEGGIRIRDPNPVFLAALGDLYAECPLQHRHALDDADCIAGICTAAIAAAFIVWISFSAYKNYQTAKSEDTSVPSYALDLSALTDYSQSMESSTSD